MQVSACRLALDLAIRLSLRASVERPTPRDHPASSCERAWMTKGRESSRAFDGAQQTPQWLDFPTQFCHASAATGIQHQDGPGTPRAQRCEDHHGVYACAESRRVGRAQPPRLAMLGTAPM